MADRENLAHQWSTMGEAVHVVFHRHHLWRTLSIALVVGTLLFGINHGDVVLSGHAVWTTWLKAGLTYLVPFAVSNYGILVATHRKSR
ncbi:MAG: nitrate/nitrite transporter NrtS [Candidatus Dormibacteria bacterium]